MTPTVFTADFRTLRDAYMEVKSFMKTECLVDVGSLNDRIYADFGYTGEDAYHLLNIFILKYHLDSKDAQDIDFFPPDPWQTPAGAVLLPLACLIFIFFWIVKIISFGRIDETKEKVFAVIPEYANSYSDLTFGDMVAWRLTGKYTLRQDIAIKLG